jgi:hypothetical protein
MKDSTPLCEHPKCGARIQQIYVRLNSRFVPTGWMYECGEVLLDNEIFRKFL